MPPQDDDVRESRQLADNLLDEIPTVPKTLTATGLRQRPNPRRSKHPYSYPPPREVGDLTKLTPMRSTFTGLSLPLPSSSRHCPCRRRISNNRATPGRGPAR